MGKKRKSKSKAGAGAAGAKSSTIARWMQLGAEAQARGASSEAITYYTKVVSKDPGNGSVWHALAGLRFVEGEYQAAISAMESAVATQPSNVEFLNDLGGLYLGAGDYSRAEITLRSIVELQPDFAHARYNLASALYQAGKLAFAIEELNRLLELEPGMAEAHFNLGIALRDSGNYRGALEAFEKSQNLSENNERADLEIARLQADSHYLPESILAYRRYLKAISDDANVLHELVSVLERNGAFDEALSALDDFARNKELIQSIEIRRAQILHNIGRLDAAESVYSSLLEQIPDATTALVGLSRLRRFTDPNDPIIAKLLSSLSKYQVDDQAAVPLQFALGKSYDDLREYDTAFAHYEAANRLRMTESSYDRTGWEAEVTKHIELYTSEVINGYREIASTSEKPVLIVGMPRSGTTLTEQIIAGHAAAAGAGELAFFETLVRQLPAMLSADIGYPQCMRTPNVEVTKQIVSHYLALLDRHSKTADRVTDKMPGNYVHLGLFRTLFSKARVVICRRDPRDVALSIYFQFFQAGHHYGWSLPNIAHHYVQHERLIDHWSRTYPQGNLTVEYGDLVSQNETTSRRLIDFLGLDWDPNCLRSHEVERSVLTASNWQVRQPLYSSSLGRWRHYERHLDEFQAALDSERRRFDL